MKLEIRESDVAPVLVAMIDSMCKVFCLAYENAHGVESPEGARKEAADAVRALVETFDLV
jgi:hypothetical protein